MKIIPPPEKTLTGGSLEWLTNDIKKVGWTSSGLDNALEVLEGRAFALDQIIQVRTDEGLPVMGFWALVDDIINNQSSYTQFNDKVGVSELEVWLEMPDSYLNDPVPVGLHDSEDEQGNQLSWSEWDGGGTQPIATSNDGTKVVVRTNINGVFPTMEELKIIGQYVTGDANISILNERQLRQLRNSAAYS